MSTNENVISGVKRIIGQHEGIWGPLVVIVGGMHGNELAGVKALELLFEMLEKEPLTNPSFKMKGRIVGLYGNMAAIQAKKRFIDVDLNRQWYTKNVARIRQAPGDALNSEDREVLGIYKTIHAEITAYRPTKIIFLDLHTTSAEDGIFSIPTGTDESYDLAKGLFAPVIYNLTDTLHGTFMQFFDVENMGIPTVSVTFESGQHDDPLSVNRSIAAIVNCLRFEGLVKPEDVESRHDQILRSYTKHLPKVVKMAYKHRFEPQEEFTMHPGFRNFSPIQKGDYLADDIHGKVLSPLNGYILMPLYQKQGNEGFFIVTE